MFYHLTTLDAATDIIGKGRFLPSLPDTPEFPVKRPFYISLARSPHSSFIRHRAASAIRPHVLFDLSPDIKREFSTKPVDYWSTSFPELARREMEERIYLDKPEKASKILSHIRKVFIIIPERMEKKEAEKIETFTSILERRGIPYFFVKGGKSFDIRKAFSTIPYFSPFGENEPEIPSPPKKDTTNEGHFFDTLSSIIEKVIRGEKLDYEEEDFAYIWLRRNPEEFTEYLSKAILRARSPSSPLYEKAMRLLRLIARLPIRSIRNLHAYLSKAIFKGER